MEVLALVTHLADAFRAWAVPGAFLSIVLVAPVAWQLGRVLVAQSFQRHGWQHTAEILAAQGTLDQSIRSPVPRFVTLIAALLFMVAIMVAGAAIPLSRVEWAERAIDMALAYNGMAGGNRAFWNGLITFSWMLWSSGCWAVAIAFSPRPAMMTAAGSILWWAAFLATQNIGEPIL